MDEQIIEKEEANNVDDLLELLQFEEVKSIDYLIDNGFIIYYLYIDSGVIITRNIDKINYFFGSKMDQIIKLCIVDISSIISSEPEYFCIHELKKQSIYFFDLTNKEINFSARNKLVNLGKDENLSDTEIDLMDEIIEEEKESYQFSQTVNPNLLIGDKKNQKDEEPEGDEGNNLITDNNEKELDLQKENSKSIENNLNAIHSKVKNFLEASDKIEEMSEICEKNEENELEEKAYEINGDNLIISGSEITPEINRELEKILFNTTTGDENPFDYVNFYSEQNNKKQKKKNKKRK